MKTIDDAARLITNAKNDLGIAQDILKEIKEKTPYKDESNIECLDDAIIACGEAFIRADEAEDCVNDIDETAEEAIEEEEKEEEQ